MIRKVAGLVVAVVLLVGSGTAHAAEQRDGPAVAEPIVVGESELALATPVLSARRAPALLRSAAADEAVAEIADEVVEAAEDTSCLVITDGRRIIYRHNEQLPLIPASTQKIGVSAAALDLLGPDHTFVTSVAAASAPDAAGVVDGDLFLVGGGDPLLVTEGFRTTLYQPDQRAVSDFSQLADALVEAGLTEVRGGVIGDESRYDSERSVPTWPDRHLTTETVGPLSALRVNLGSTGLSLNPEVAAPDRQPGDPPFLAAETLRTLLEDRGVEVQGPPDVGETPAEVSVLAEHQSPPLSVVVDEIMAWSNNGAAEMLLKEIGLAAYGEGSSEAGAAHVYAYLESADLDVAGIEFRDGSGLDEGNRLTCQMLTMLLGRLDQESAVVEGLAVAGDYGTLHNRLRNTPAEGRVRAKTGTLNSVVALAGYVDTTGDRTLTFASLMNIPPEGAPEATADRHDDLVLELAHYPRVPLLEDVQPLAPVPVDQLGSAGDAES